jgi:dihydrodipicolinate synthase/N-acetylneuraminate lyase
MGLTEPFSDARVYKIDGFMTPTSPAELTSPILATAVVPWTDRFEFAAEPFIRQVRHLARRVTRHIYLFGTAGEGYAVTERQFDEIAACFAAVAREEQVTPMLGLISLSLPTIIERIERGRALGVREFQLSLPAWGALQDRELDLFFAETAGRFPDCRFLHYNLMRTKRLLTSVEYRRLTAAHPNLVAVKTGASDPAAVADLLTVSPRLRFYFGEFGYPIARRTHDVGLLISLASINPALARRYVEGTDADRADLEPDLRVMLNVLLDLARDRFHVDGAFDKLIHRVSDPTFPLRLLPPYASADESDYARFLAALPARWRPVR